MGTTDSKCILDGQARCTQLYSHNLCLSVSEGKQNTKLQAVDIVMLRVKGVSVYFNITVK